ncbi:MAG TPA: glycosyltransferase family 4 protein [Acidobacteriota bacterium]|nr:glycosyltransferase family 4 protein [Acidobacteriota bacterium]
MRVKHTSARGSSSWRVLFVSDTAQLGGPSHSLLRLLAHLGPDHEPGVLVPEDGPLVARLEKLGVPCVKVPEMRAKAVLKICQVIIRGRYAAVYGNDSSTCTRYALVAGTLLRKPVIWHIRGMKEHWGWRKGVFLRLADEVIAVSEACARSLSRFLSPASVHVIHNGVEASDFNVDRTAARGLVGRELGLSDSTRLIITVSHVIPRKGIEKAVEVFSKVSQRFGDDVHLLILGRVNTDPAYVEAVRRKIERGRLGQRVHLLGFRDDVIPFLAASDIFLHTASRDPHPRAVLEAMAAGLPVVSFAVDGLVETVVDGQTGFLIPPGDVESMAERLSLLLDSPPIAKRLGCEGQLRVRKCFSATSTAKRVAEVIEQALKARE